MKRVTFAVKAAKHNDYDFLIKIVSNLSRLATRLVDWSSTLPTKERRNMSKFFRVFWDISSDEFEPARILM